MKPHIHAEAIKAWADGAEIEYLSERTNCWWSCTSPDWLPHIQYRIKPEPRPDVVKKYNVSLQKGFTYVDTDNQLYYPANLILFFDGVSGHLKSAEVIS